MLVKDTVGMMQNDEVYIKKASKEDIKSIEQISKDNCKNPWNKDQLEEEVQHDFSLLICAKSNNKIIGFANMHITEPEAHLNEIVVEEKSRHKGTGTKLLSYCIEYAKTRGCEYVTLEVRASNYPAIDIYTKKNFIRLGEREGFYRNPAENAIVMRLNI